MTDKIECCQILYLCLLYLQVPVKKWANFQVTNDDESFIKVINSLHLKIICWGNQYQYFLN